MDHNTMEVKLGKILDRVRETLPKTTPPEHSRFSQDQILRKYGWDLRSHSDRGEVYKHDQHSGHEIRVRPDGKTIAHHYAGGDYSVYEPTGLEDHLKDFHDIGGVGIRGFVDKLFGDKINKVVEGRVALERMELQKYIAETEAKMVEVYEHKAQELLLKQATCPHSTVIFAEKSIRWIPEGYNSWINKEADIEELECISRDAETICSDCDVVLD